MKRRNFIKTLAAACAVPVVAAKAVASRRDKRIVLSNGSTMELRTFDSCPNTIRALKDYKPTHAYSLRNLNTLDIPHDPRVAHYDQSGNGNHIFKKTHH